jgi:hypothetical protein
MIRHAGHFRVAHGCRFRFCSIVCFCLLKLITVPGKSASDQPSLTTYESAKPPRPRRDPFYPEFFQPTDRLIMVTDTSIEVIVFALTLLSILVLNQ